MGARFRGKPPENSSGKSSAGPKKVFGMKATKIGYLSPIQTKAPAIKSSLGKSIVTNNRYMIGEKNLSEFNDESMEQENVNKHGDDKPKKNNPIIIVGSNVVNVQNLCDKVIKSKKFEIKLLGIGIKVQVSDKAEFDSLLKSLNEKKIKNFLYHTADTRPRKIVLSGLHEMDLDELKEELKELNVFPTDIRTLRLRQNRLNYDNQCVYLLYFAPGSVKLSELNKVKHIFNITVKWAPYSAQSHNKYPQCHNCQMYGHSSINCNMTSQCAVCSNEHKTENCPKKIKRAVLQHLKDTNQPIDTSYIKCANCGLNHPATYNGCQSRKAYVEIQKRLQQRNTRRPSQQPYRLNQEDFPELEEPRWISHTQSHSSYSNAAQQQQQYQQSDANMQQFMMSMMTTVNKLVDKVSMMIEQLTKILGNISTPQP